MPLSLAPAGGVLVLGRLLVGVQQPIDVTRDEALAWLAASVQEELPAGEKLDLLVLDPLRLVSGASEDSSDEMSDVMRRLKVLSYVLDDCTVMVVHHTAKKSGDSKRRTPGQRLRGSGALHASIDSGLYIRDTSYDGGSFFSRLDVEVKGARSAGTFGLQLEVHDDSNGEATWAHWSLRSDAKASRGGLTTEAEQAKYREAILGYIASREAADEPAISKTAIADDTPGHGVAQKTARLVIRGLITDGVLVNSNHKVTLPRSVAAGTATARQ